MPHDLTPSSLTRRLVILLLALNVALFAGPRADAVFATAGTGLEALFARDLEAKEWQGASMAAYVVDLEDGRVLVAINSKMSLRPASCMKVVSSAFALDAIGGDHVIKTPTHSVGTLTPTGTLDGYILVTGKGDPGWSGRYDPGGGSTRHRTDKWAEAIKAAGIQRITGGVIVDGSMFQGPGICSTWEIEDLREAYAAPASAMAINDNTIDVRIRPGAAEGDPVDVDVQPPQELIIVINEATTGPKGSGDNIVVERKTGTNELIVHGKLAAGSRPTGAWLSVQTDGNLFSAYVLDAALRRAGVRVDVPPRVLASMEKEERDALKSNKERTLLSEIASDPFKVRLARVNKPSQNLHAEMAFRLGAVARGGSDLLSGTETALTGWLKKKNIPTEGFALADGSGLSWRNAVTAEMMVGVLRAMDESDNASVFIESLPVAGVDGTLEGRMGRGPAMGAIKAKTGYIHSTRNLCGYAQTKSGHRLAFAFLANNYGTSTGRVNRLHDSWCERLVTWTPDGVPAAKSAKKK